MSPEYVRPYVRPYVKSHKNDEWDAEAIAAGGLATTTA
jgi:hypothetical protein